ncbi:MAG: tRNA delta(2)-isopentenylpyrophosphate transferase [Parcubacteria group bacterium Athens0714_16]|nr:MAG: tRNA delta(2)-isopentenylpyrophosphate transferase [Parcubacteria group bacterium Athens0714_16]
MTNKKQKIIVILGPTASGKSDLAVKLAKKINGEIISADSRQVYKGMNIGTGKITSKEMGKIPHHLLDIKDPKKQFTVVDFKKLTEKEIQEILKRNKTPIICGGTGFYIDAIVKNINFTQVGPDKKLRKELEKKSVEELFRMLKKLNPARSKNIDSKNKRRLIRAIEIAKNHKITKSQNHKIKENKLSPYSLQLGDKQKYEFLEIGAKTENEKLRKLIHDRLIKRIKKGMINEVKKLHENGVSWKRLDDFGLEYRFISRYLRGLLSKDEMIQQLETKIWQFSKRQKTWFKRNKNIKWFELKDYKKIEKELKEFL